MRTVPWTIFKNMEAAFPAGLRGPRLMGCRPQMGCKHDTTTLSVSGVEVSRGSVLPVRQQWESQPECWADGSICFSIILNLAEKPQDVF